MGTDRELVQGELFGGKQEPKNLPHPRNTRDTKEEEDSPQRNHKQEESNLTESAIKKAFKELIEGNVTVSFEEGEYKQRVITLNRGGRVVGETGNILAKERQIFTGGKMLIYWIGSAPTLTIETTERRRGLGSLLVILSLIDAYKKEAKAVKLTAGGSRAIIHVLNSLGIRYEEHEDQDPINRTTESKTETTRTIITITERNLRDFINKLRALAESNEDVKNALEQVPEKLKIPE